LHLVTFYKKVTIYLCSSRASVVQQLWSKFFRVVFVSVNGATSGCFCMSFFLFRDPLKLCRKVPIVHSREYFPCFLWHYKWFLCSRVDSLPSVDSVPRECPCSHLSDLMAEMGPTDCIKTKFSKLTSRFAVSALCTLRRLFHTITLQSVVLRLNVDLCETFVSVGYVSVSNFGT
jgi:hypothetical protein